MKRRILLRHLRKAGFQCIRHGAEHDIYSNGIINIAVPRHNEINENTASKILKQISKN